MRNARSKSTFRPRWRRRIAGKAGGQAYPILKSVTSSTGDFIYDPEVSAWAKRVNSAGGSVSNSCLEASSAFIRTIKNQPGLRQKIKRLNLFCGSNLDSSLMPLIIDEGPTQDINHNFASTEYSEKSGIKNSTASGNKYLDTGLDLSWSAVGLTFNDAHIAISTLGANTSSSYKEWIGRDHFSLGSNKENRKLQFRVGEHTIYADNPNPQQGACMGFYLGNCWWGDVSLRLNNRSLENINVSNNSPSNADLSQNFHIFKRNTAYSAPDDFDQTVNFYSIGLGLSDSEATVLYDAVSVFNQAKNRELFEALDIEVWKWANHRIPEAVGDASAHFSSLLVQNASAWMESIKNNNLREKINRANLFLGKSSSNYGYLTSLVPLIIDSGHRTDINNNFLNSDYNLKFGLHGDGATKFLDTGITTRELVSASSNSGHLSVEATSPSPTNTSSSSSNCLIGSKESISTAGGVGMSISLSKTKMTTKAWTALSKSAVPATQGMFTSSIGAGGSNSNARTYFNGAFLSDNSNDIQSTSYDSSLTGSTISLFTLNTVEYGNLGHSSQSIKSYSIGKALTDDEVQNLYAANSNVKRVEIVSDDMDSEVYDWANYRVPANGGLVTQKEAEAVNAWMLKIKTSSGLREKLKRVNLMAGSNLAAKMVPLIVDSGYSKVDKNTNLSEGDSVSTGLRAGDEKSIDTTVKLSDFLTNSSGHFSVKNYASLDTLIMGDTFAHGVITNQSSYSSETSAELLVSSDHVNGSNVFTDSSGAGHAITNHGNTSHQNAVGNPFGSGSAIKFDGSSDYLTVADSASWTFGSGDFTIETWINFSAWESTNFNTIAWFGPVQIDYKRDGGTKQLRMFCYSSGGNTSSIQTWDASLDTWYHIAAVRDSGNLRLFVNGTSLGTPPAHEGNTTLTNATGASAIMARAANSVSGVGSPDRKSAGYIYDFRVSKEAKYSDDFSKPTASFGSTGGPKPALGLTIDSNGVKGYVWDNNRSNAVSYAKLNQATTETKKTVDTSSYSHPTLYSGQPMPYWGYLNTDLPGEEDNQADVSYIVEDNGDHVIDIPQLKQASTWGPGPAAIIVYKNGVIQTHLSDWIHPYAWPIPWSRTLTDLAVGDKIKVVIQYPDWSAPGWEAWPNVWRIGAMENTTVFFKRIVPSTQNALDGLWTVSRTSATASSLYLDGSPVASSTASSNVTNVSDDYVNIMGSYSDDGSIQNHHDNASRIGFYSLGLSLTDAEALTLSEAITAFDTKMRRDLDEEVWDWAYTRVPLNGGSLSESNINNVNTFMLALKTESGLRESIKRLNVFAGSNLSSAMVPLIKDFGDSIEKNYNFTSSDVNQGLNSSGSKYLDTGMSFSELDIISYSNFHVALSRKGNSVSGYANSDAIGNGSIRLNLTNRPVVPVEGADNLIYSGSTITSSTDGSGFLVGTAVNNTETKLYKGSTSSDTGPFDGSSSMSANNFIVCGNQTEAGVVAQFSGRISIYSLGIGLTSGQVSAFNSAVSALELSLERGDFEASNSDAWKWANINVPANGGLVSQKQVTAVNKFMDSISNIHNLRDSIKRMNLFVGENLNAALVPVVSDLGASVETNNNFISSDYISTGPDAGLTGGSGKTLDLKIKARDLGDNFVMALRSNSGSTFDSSSNAPIMGVEEGFSSMTMGSNLGKLSFFTSISSAQTIDTSHYIKTPAIFKDLPRNYNGCDIVGNSILEPSLNTDVGESSCETLENAVSSYDIPNHSFIDSSLSRKILNDRLYCDYRNSDILSRGQQFYGDAGVNFSIDHEKGRNSEGVVALGENGDFCKGFYSVLCSKVEDSNISKLKMYKNGQEMVESQMVNQNIGPAAEIALFGKRNGSVFHSFPSSINIDFYCLGSNAETPDASKNPDVLGDGFLPNEVHNFLIQLDVDLNRKDFQKPDATNGILGNLQTLTSELDPEVSKWANEKVPKVGGKLNPEIVLAVNAWMTKIKERAGLRQKLKRVNLFSSVNLAGALVPIITDEGYPVDLNQGTVQFSEDDFILGRLDAGTSWSSLDSVPEKYLDTGLNPSKAGISWSNFHMGFASSSEKLHGNKLFGAQGYPTPISVNCGDVIGDSTSNDEARISTYIECTGGVDHRGADPRDPLTPGQSCRQYLNPNLAQGRFSNYIQLPSHHEATHSTLYMVTKNSHAHPHHLRTFQNGILRGIKYNGWYESLDQKFREDKNFLLFAEHADQLNSFELVDDMIKYGGMIVPSRHSLTPIKFSDGRYYIFALTDQKFTLQNLVYPSSNTNNCFKEYVSDVYGYGWEPLNYSEVKTEFWNSDRPEGVYNFDRLIKDLKHGHRYDKSIGWLDPDNMEGFGTNHATQSSRLLLYNDKQSAATKVLNTHNAYDSDLASKTIVRNVNSSDKDVACGTCGFDLVSAPVLMKIEVPNSLNYSDTVHNQTWGSDITYYSAGVTIEDSDVSHLNSAYLSFVEALDLKNYHGTHLGAY